MPKQTTQQNQNQAQDLRRRSSFLFGYDLLSEKIGNLDLDFDFNLNDDEFDDDEGPLFSQSFIENDSNMIKKKKSVSNSSLSLSSESSSSCGDVVALAPVSPASVFTDFASSSKTKLSSQQLHTMGLSLEETPHKLDKQNVSIEKMKKKVTPESPSRRDSLEYSPDFKLDSRRKCFPKNPAFSTADAAAAKKKKSNSNTELNHLGFRKRLSSHTISEVWKDCDFGNDDDDLLFDEENMPHLPTLRDHL